MALNRINYLKDSVIKRIAQQKVQPKVNPATKQDTMQHITALPIDEEQAMHNGELITIITLITTTLAGICMLFYMRSKRRNK